MLELNLIDHEVALEAARRQGKLWDDVIEWWVERLAGVSNSEWTGETTVTVEELYEDLQFGRS